MEMDQVKDYVACKALKTATTTQPCKMQNVFSYSLIQYLSLLLPEGCFHQEPLSSIRASLTSLKQTDGEEYVIHDSIYPEQ